MTQLLTRRTLPTGWDMHENPTFPAGLRANGYDGVTGTDAFSKEIVAVQDTEMRVIVTPTLLALGAVGATGSMAGAIAGYRFLSDT